jgi:DNA-binding NarL/FixJ family response regulator
MTPIRVLVAYRPRLMRELLIATISDQPDIEIVGEVSEQSGIQDAVDQTKPDFLIVALDSHDRPPDFCHSLLQTHPQIKILAIAPNRNTTVFYWASLQVQSSQIEASEAGVLNALRGVKRSTERVQ